MKHVTGRAAGSDVLPVGAQTVAELDVADTLPFVAFAAYGVPRAFADRFAFPLAPE